MKMGSRKIIDLMGLVAVDGESHSQPRTAGPTCSRLDRCRVSAVPVRHMVRHASPHPQPTRHTTQSAEASVADCGEYY